jgi:hypothetical protein
MTPTLDNPLRRLAVFVQLPIPRQVVVLRVENRPLEELIVHTQTDLNGHPDWCYVQTNCKYRCFRSK